MSLGTSYIVPETLTLSNALTYINSPLYVWVDTVDEDLIEGDKYFDQSGVVQGNYLFIESDRFGKYVNSYTIGSSLIGQTLEVRIFASELN